MPLVKVLGYSYVTLSYRFAGIHWTEITRQVRFTHGTGQVDDPIEVNQILQEILSYLIESFKDVVKENRSIPFLMFVHGIHESSMFISNKVQHDPDAIFDLLPEQDIKDLPGVRRILKLIMEEILIESFDEEIDEQIKTKSLPNKYNVEALEELLYLGIQALQAVDQISKSAIFKKSIAFKSHRKNQLTSFTKSPYFQLIETISEDMATYSTHYYHDANDMLDGALKKTFGINLTEFLSALGMPLGSLIVPKQEYLREIATADMPIEKLELFSSGLTLSYSNKMPIELSFYKMQENNRLVYRPIIEFKDKF
ncbi:MAG: hypothetical protein EOO01_09255, partial [Chitinophagaceae bacterium]